jgi:uncharacterized membrane protein (DUF106 family)
MQDAIDGLVNGVVNIISQVWEGYSVFIGGIFLGLIIAYLYHKLIGARAIKKSHHVLYDSQEKRIQALNMIVAERLGKLEDGKKDKTKLIKRIKKAFKESFI